MAPNLLAQDFSADAPGKVWLTDITYVRTDEGWLYLAGVKDVFTQEIVGYAMSRRMTHELTLEALNRAVRYARPEPGLLHHSDRGSQYCASRYRERLDALGMQASMSRRGNCYDNAPMESFWGSLKNELLYQRRFATHAQARMAITDRGVLQPSATAQHAWLPVASGLQARPSLNGLHIKSNCLRLTVHLSITPRRRYTMTA